MTFKEEDAVGDGIAMDVYSAFFNHVHKLIDGSFQRVSTNFDETELRIIGKIITHCFIR